MDFGLKGPHPLLDGGCGPCFWGVVLEGGVGRLKHVWERWWLVRCGRGCGDRGSAGAASVFVGGEFQSMCLEFLPCAGKILGSGFERSAPVEERAVRARCVVECLGREGAGTGGVLGGGGKA